MKHITNPRLTRALSLVPIACAMLALSAGRVSAHTDQDLVEVARSVVKADRQAVVVAAMDLTDDESKAFWPLYHEYRSEMDKVGDRRMKLVLDYAKLYPN